MQIAGGSSETAFDNEQMDTSIGDANQELGNGLSSALPLPTESLRVHQAPRAAASTSDVTAGGSGSPLFLADASVVNMARRSSVRSRNDPARQSAFETGILPLLGVSEDAHTSLPSYQALPGDQEIIRLFELFRRRVQPFHLITYDLDKVEEKICRLVNARSDPDSGSSSDDACWICLLHAILAAGAQFSDMDLEDRIAVTQRHSTL